MKRIKENLSISDIESSTEGRLLISAIARITTTTHQDSTPDEVLRVLVQDANELQTKIEEVEGRHNEKTI